MATTSLPPSFAWQDHFEGQTLTLHGRTIAFSTPLPNGHVHCTRKLNTRHITHSFHDDLEQAARFMEGCPGVAPPAWVSEISTICLHAPVGLGTC